MTSIDMTGLWRFQPDPAGTGLMRGYVRMDYDDHRWREVSVPIDFETCHPGLDTYEGAGWFRRWVDVPLDWAGQRIVLRFEGVNAHARVWLNGHEVGAWEDPFLPYEINVTGTVVPGQRNLVVARIDNERRRGDVPGMQRGWRNYGGILREVTLYATDLCYLVRQTVVAEPVEGGGRLEIQAYVRNSRRVPVDARIDVVVSHPQDPDAFDAVQLVSTGVSILEGDEAALTVSGHVAGVTPWSPDRPSLYTASVTLRVVSEGSNVIDRRELQIGFRSIEARDGRVLLNGAPIFLTGFNRHEDSPETAMCPDPALTRRDLGAMKAAGANSVRLCHYPHHPAELDLCDELGLLAMVEIPLYWWDGLAEGHDAAAAKLVAARRQLETLIRRDRCHPSVAFWSVSNETHEEREEVASGNRELVRLAKRLDPTRLAVHVSDHWQQHPNFEADDVICVNGYPSVGPLAGGGDPDYDLADSTAFWREGLAALHEQNPDKPILVTEFGYTSLHGVTDNAFSGDTHAAVLASEFAGMDAAYVCGAIVWCWADHAWPPATFAFCGHLAVSPYGVVTRDRRRKTPYWAARRLFRARQGLADPPKGNERPLPTPSGYEVTMVRPSMEGIADVAFPAGYSIRAMRPDEGGLWTDIWRDAEEFASIESTLFENEFGDDLEALRWRGYIVQDDHGVGVATITSWYNRTHKGQDYGQIHWVATRRSHWGRGLGKAMLSHALRQMAQWHSRAYLGTQTKRLAAIKLYLDFGFVPDLDDQWAREAWAEVRTALDHPALRALGL
jgi:beta-glucuronidase